MEKEKHSIVKKIIAVVVTALGMLGMCWLVACMIEEAKQMDYKNEEKEEISQRAYYDDCIKYSDALCIDCDFTYDGKAVYAGSPVFHDNELMVSVSFYNVNHPKNTITMEQLYKEYELLLKGGSKELFPNLIEFANFDEDRTHSSIYEDAEKEKAVFYNYRYDIRDELRRITKKKAGNGEAASEKVYIYNADTEELKEAIETIEKTAASNFEYITYLCIEGDLKLKYQSVEEMSKEELQEIIDDTLW